MAPRTPSDHDAQHRDDRREAESVYGRRSRYIEHSGRDDGPAMPADILTGDTISVIVDWSHFAILELTRLDEFRCDSTAPACS